MAIVVLIVWTERALGKHHHHVVVHPIADCDTERVTTDHRRPIMEPGIDTCDVYVLDYLTQARVVPRNAGKARAGEYHVDGIAAAIVLDYGDGGGAHRAMRRVELGMARRLAKRCPVRSRVEG